MFNYSQEKMKEPNITILRMKGYCDTNNKMSSVIKALNKLHNKTDHLEEYKRNKDTYELLRDIEILHPIVTEAINMERQMFLNILEEISKVRIFNNNNSIEEVKVGIWWYLLLNKAKQVFLPAGPCKITLDEYSLESTVFFEGEGYTSTMPRDKIRIVK